MYNHVKWLNALHIKDSLYRFWKRRKMMEVSHGSKKTWEINATVLKRLGVAGACVRHWGLSNNSLVDVTMSHVYYSRQPV